MKQKWIALLLALVLALSVLTACGSDANKPTETTEQTEITEPVEQIDPNEPVVAISPVGETDVVDPTIRAFLDAAAERYNEGDTRYNYTVKDEKEDTLGSRPSKATFAWELRADDVRSVVVQYSEDPDFADFRESKGVLAETTSVDVVNLKTGTTYYWRLLMKLTNGEETFSKTFTFETKPGPRVLEVGGVNNIRDMGGWLTENGLVVPHDRVFRSATLDHPEMKGKTYLLEKLGIKTELDFRNDEKDSRKPVLTELNYINVQATPGYSNYYDRTEANAEILRVFTKPENYPIIFHCAEGADRTGVEGFMLNALCGVGEADLICDYELTAGRFRDGSHTPAHTFDFPGFMRKFIRLEGNTAQERARSYFLNECGIGKMELANYYALRMENHGVYADPPKEPIPVQNGTISAQIVLRDSTAITSVTDENGASLQFTFEDGLLTVTVSDAGSGMINFEGGGELLIQWA